MFKIFVKTNNKFSLQLTKQLFVYAIKPTEEAEANVRLLPCRKKPKANDAPLFTVQISSVQFS